MTELDEGDPFPDLDAASALRAAFKQRGCAATAARDAAPGFAAAVDRQGYALEGEIAHGGMGVIVKAFDRDLTRDVALKVLRDELTGEARCVRRFFEEPRITARPDHPGIVPVHQVGLDLQGRPYFAMRL